MIDLDYLAMRKEKGHLLLILRQTHNEGYLSRNFVDVAEYSNKKLSNRHNAVLSTDESGTPTFIHMGREVAIDSSWIWR